MSDPGRLPGIDDQNESLDQYTRIWSSRELLLTAIEARLAPRSSSDATGFFPIYMKMMRYSGVLSKYLEQFGTPSDWGHFFQVARRNLDDAAAMRPLMVNDKVVHLTRHARELVYRDLVSTSLLAWPGARADCFVELGSGWSTNIFNLWRNGGPAGATYFGCEPTEPGRGVAARLAAMQNIWRYKAVPFDYRRPDFSFLPAASAQMLVFTCASIEQVTNLDAAFFDRLLESSRGVTAISGVHIEPVGWQFATAANGVVAGPELPQWAHRARAISHHRKHNLNFKSVLDGAASRGLIRIKSVELRSIGTDPNYPSATIRWERV